MSTLRLTVGVYSAVSQLSGSAWPCTVTRSHIWTATSSPAGKVKPSDAFAATPIPLR